MLVVGTGVLLGLAGSFLGAPQGIIRDCLRESGGQLRKGPKVGWLTSTLELPCVRPYREATVASQELLERGGQLFGLIGLHEVVTWWVLVPLTSSRVYGPCDCRSCLLLGGLKVLSDC